MARVYVFIYLIFCTLGINAQTSKLSPYVRQAMEGNKIVHLGKLTGLQRKQIPTITAFVRTTDTSVLRQQGCHIYAQWDDICIASIPLSKIGDLASMSQIKRIEASQSCCVANDTSATITHARDVWQTSIPSTLTGNGVVIGVMDIGFDLTHPTFYSTDGQTYRIKQLWDQIDQTNGGEPVTGDDTIYVGRQYVGEDALLTLQHSYDGLTQYHGTHTTSTAAGAGFYSGMAPDADICLVANAAEDNADLIPKEELYKYTTATDMLGFKYIFDYADKVGKPCVVNFSEGAHDELYKSSLYSEVLSKMLGPGHILCASAGNESGGDGTYMHKMEGEQQKGAFVAKWSKNEAKYVLRSKKPVEMRLSFYQNEVKVADRNYTAQPTDSMVTDTVFLEGDTILVGLDTYSSCYDESMYATDLFLVDLTNKRYGYATPTSLTLLGNDNDIEAFSYGGYFIKNNLDTSLADFEQTHNILFPGAAEDVICVGATSYVKSWKNIAGDDVGKDWGVDGIRAGYSSVGPTLSGLVKPDVVAPGTNLVSAYNSFWRESNPTVKPENDILHVTFDGRIYPWGISTGTSMSSPVVAGIIALWLQICPSLTPDQVKDVIAHTAVHYDESLTYPNNQYGWGQIDALAGVEYIQRIYTGIEEVNVSDTANSSYGIYTLDGKKINGKSSVHGVYVETNNGKTRKVIK